jgi:hypothetical protein
MPPIWADEHDELMQALHTRRVGEVMITDIVTVQPDTPVEDAAKLLYTHRIGCLPVLEDDRLVGILTETHLLRAFAELFGSRTPSKRLEVQMPNRPGELARVVRLIDREEDQHRGDGRATAEGRRGSRGDHALAGGRAVGDRARAAHGRLSSRHTIARERPGRRLRPDRRVRPDASPGSAVRSRHKWR